MAARSDNTRPGGAVADEVAKARDVPERQGGTTGRPPAQGRPDASGGAPDASGGGPTAADDGRPLGSRAPRFIRRSRPLHLSWQVAVFLVGLAVVALGVVMLPLPGPGWVVVFLGMGIWATEFVWAQLALRWTRRQVAEAARKAMDPRVRRRNITLAAIGLAVLAALGGWYLSRYGSVMPWHLL